MVALFRWLDPVRRFGKQASRVVRLGRRRVVLVAAVAALVGHVGDHAPVASAAPHKPRAWFDAKGAFVFPLGDGPLPMSRDALAEALTEGWRRNLRFPEGGEIVSTEGGRYPAIGSLNMRLGGGIDRDDEVKEKKHKTPLHPSGKVEARVAVRNFDLDARPLIFDKAKLDIHISATDARLDMEHDDHGRAMVMLADANDATLQLEATNEDVERMLIQDLNEAVHSYGVYVRKATLKLSAVDDRAIDVDLHLSTRVAYVPAGLHFQAHVDIDSQMNARLSHLKCDGDEAIGPLIMSLVRPGMAKYEGKSRPVFSFPTGQLQLRDVKIQGGENIKIAAHFAR